MEKRANPKTLGSWHYGSHHVSAFSSDSSSFGDLQSLLQTHQIDPAHQ